MEGQSGRKRKIDDLHNKLKTKIALDILDERVDGGRPAKRFRCEARKFLESETDRAEKDPVEILDRLEAKGHIAPGKYDNLKEIVEPIDIRIVGYIQEKEEEIKEISVQDERINEGSCLSEVARNIYHDLHNKLKIKISFDFLDERKDGGRQAKRFRCEARKFLESETDRAEKDPFEILDRLEAKGHIAPGKYDNLMEIVEPIDIKIMDYIKKKADEMKEISVQDERINEGSCLSEVARNIYRTTELEILEHRRDKAYVPLSFVSEGDAILDRFGILVIVGKSGSGKSKCALEILSSRGKSGKDMIFKLSSLCHWYEVVNPNKKICILFDDLFEKRVDQTLRFEKSSFESMMSTVKNGKVKVILTMNDKAHENYKTDFETIFRNEMILHIQMETLSPRSKFDILKSHLANNELCISTDEEFLKQKYDCPQEVRNKYISESEVDAILRSNPPRTSIKMSTPCMFQQKHRDQTPKRVLKKVLSREQLSQQMEKYKRCQKIGNLSNDDYNAAEIQQLLQKRPALPCELLKETIHKVVRDGHGAILNVFLDMYDKHNLLESILKELIFEGNSNQNIAQCIHNRFDRDIMQYITFAKKESIPTEKLFICLSRNRCLFPPFNILKATEEMTQHNDKNFLKILLNSLDTITESFSVHKMFSDACRDGKLCILELLLNGNYIKDSKITDAFVQCCVHEKVEGMKTLFEKRRHLFTDEFISKAAEKCCDGCYLSSLYYLLCHVSLEFSCENYMNLCLSLLIKSKDKNVLLFLLSYCGEEFSIDGRVKKFYKELLLRASSKNSLILRCLKAVDEDYFCLVDDTTKVKAVKNLRKNRQFEGINLWYLWPDTEKQQSRLFSVSFSDEQIELVLQDATGLFRSLKINEAISLLVLRQEKEKLSRLLTRDISVICEITRPLEPKSKEFIFDCLPPLSQEVERTIIELSECKISLFQERELTIIGFLSLAEHYEFSTETIDRLHANFCLTQELDALQQFLEKFNPSLSEDCLNNACCNIDLSVLSFLIHRDNFPQNLIKLTEYILYYILRATYIKFDSQICSTLVNIIYKTKNGATALTEPLCNASDLHQVWTELTGLFCDDITNEIIIKVAKLCCEQCWTADYEVLLFFSENSVLSESDVLDCCKMIVNIESHLWFGLPTCARMLKNLHLSHCLEFARVVINTKNTNCHEAFTSEYLQECGNYNIFGKVCKRWNDLDRRHPYYRKQALSLIDEFANI